MTTDAYHEAIYHGARPGAIRAEIDVEVSHEWDDVPSIGECRFGVLQIVTGEDRGEIQTGYVIYDRLLNRIVDGVYFSHESALDVADSCNTVGQFSPRAPNSRALGLTFPGQPVGEED